MEFIQILINLSPTSNPTPIYKKVQTFSTLESIPEPGNPANVEMEEEKGHVTKGLVVCTEPQRRRKQTNQKMEKGHFKVQPHNNVIKDKSEFLFIPTA